jgi:hypothetical protein
MGARPQAVRRRERPLRGSDLQLWNDEVGSSAVIHRVCTAPEPKLVAGQASNGEAVHKQGKRGAARDLLASVYDWRLLALARPVGEIFDDGGHVLRRDGSQVDIAHLVDFSLPVGSRQTGLVQHHPGRMAG